MDYKVPRVLWENLESVLLAQSKKYVSELASRLHVSEKELIKKVLPTSDSLRVLIIDSHAESNQCKAYIQENKVTMFCKKPVTSHSEYCNQHIHKRMMVLEDSNTKHVQKVKDSNIHEQLWVVDNNVINMDGNIVGKCKHSENVLKLFVIE